MKYPEHSGVLRRLSEHDDLKIGRCDGSRTFARPNQVFVYAKSAPVHHPRSTEPTGEVALAFYEPLIEASMPQMFGSLSQEINTLCFTEHQIVAFCEEHTSLLRRMFPTFLLFRIGRMYFVAWAFDYGHAPVITIHDFYRTSSLPKDPYRLVVPERAF